MFLSISSDQGDLSRAQNFEEVFLPRRYVHRMEKARYFYIESVGEDNTSLFSVLRGRMWRKQKKKYFRFHLFTTDTTDTASYSLSHAVR